MYKYFIIPVCFALLVSSCTQDVELKLPDPEEKIVVEGHIEQDGLPYVILTKNSNVFAPVDQDFISSLFVHDAEVTIFVDQDSFKLVEYSSNDLPITIEDMPEDFEFFVYSVDFTDLSQFFLGEIGKTYTLTVRSGAHRLKAVTSIPHPAKLDSMWSTPHPDPEVDSLVLVRGWYVDPDTAGNFARYFTKRNSEPFYSNYFNSVYDDNFVNATGIEIVLERGEDKTNPDIDFDTYAYFWKGDTVILRWCSIDKAHFEFWRTADQQRTTADNPFSSPTIVSSNVEGGLGVWGGYGVFTDTLIIPE